MALGFPYERVRYYASARKKPLQLAEGNFKYIPVGSVAIIKSVITFISVTALIIKRSMDQSILICFRPLAAGLI